MLAAGQRIMAARFSGLLRSSAAQSAADAILVLLVERALISRYH
jgi:hypothetical protein